MNCVGPAVEILQRLERLRDAYDITINVADRNQRWNVVVCRTNTAAQPPTGENPNFPPR